MRAVREAFFAKVRELFGPLHQAQVDGLNILLDTTAGVTLKHRAYILATAWHETAKTMQPIVERGQRSYFNKYEPGTSRGKALGNTLMGDGYKFRGRGYVQITGRRNYAKAGTAVGADLLAHPEKALEPGIAARIILDGLEQGWFTGKRLADFPDYRNMRRTVNGLDCADVIAGYADHFEAALTA